MKYIISERQYLLITEQSDYAMDRTANAILHTTGIRKKADYEQVNKALVVARNGRPIDFESIRNFLLSGSGTVVQAFATMSGYGAVAVEIIWAMMAIYDGYQLLFNHTDGSFANLIIDLICILTAGKLGGKLTSFIKTPGMTFETLFPNLAKKGFGKIVAPFFDTIKNGTTNLYKYIDDALKIMTEKFGFTWASKVINSIKNIFGDLIKKLSSFLGKITNVGVGSMTRAGVQLSGTFKSQILTNLAHLADRELAAYFGTNIDKSIIKAAEKYANEYLKEKPIQTALSALDAKFGTHIGDAYALYLNGKKLGKNQSKISSGKITTADIGADLLKGDNTLNKGQKYSNKIAKNANNIG